MNRYFFFSIVLLIYFFLHYFVYVRVIKGLGLSGIAPKILGIIFFLAAVSFFLDRFMHQHNIFLTPLSYFSSLWLGIISIAFSLFVLQYALGIIFPHKIKLLTTCVIILLLCISIFSLLNARITRIKEIHIPVKDLSLSLKGFKIVHLSDLHLNGLKSLEWFQSIIISVNNLNPDLIVITGDLIDSGCDGLEKFCEPLRQLKSSYGVFAITGNHEFYMGVNRFLEFAEKSNIIVLRNSSQTIANAIELIGIDDDAGKRFSMAGSDLKKAIKDCDLLKPLILLSHQPKYFRKASEMGVDIQLSGHTHAGQIPPMDLIVYLLYKYPYGLYRNNSSYIYTTCGIGTWGPPMRLFSRSEIVKIILEN